MEACQQKLITINSENDDVQPAVVLQNNINECNQKTENLLDVTIIDDKSVMLRSERSNSLCDNMNVVDEIEYGEKYVNAVLNEDFLELAKESEKETGCEIKVISESKDISTSPSDKVFQNSINYCNKKTENLSDVKVDDKRIMVRNDLSNSLLENMNIEKEIDCVGKYSNGVVNDDFIELGKKSQKETICEVISEPEGISSCLGEKALQSNIDECNQKTENLPEIHIGDESIMLGNELSNSVPENMNVEGIECAKKYNNVIINNDFVQLTEKPEKETCCEVKVIFESKTISSCSTNSSAGCENSKVINEGQSVKKNNMKKTVDVDGYRCESDSWSEDDDSSSTSDTSSDSDFFQMIVESSVPKKFPLAKTKGELGLDDLPPIEDLVITVHEAEMVMIGKIYAVVDKLVVIRALKDMKALDLDSVLFLSHDKPLGRVFDVFGPVVEPFYCVRFNSVDHINEKGIEVGGDVFFAPEKSDITSYVFVDELQKQKGSDASWKYNNEPPEECLDFSDDEKEKVAKRKRMTKNRNRHFSNNSDVAIKRPTLTGDSSFRSNYTPAVCHTSSRNDVQILSPPFSRRNPFSTPLAPVSPSPSLRSIMSSPVRVQNSFNFSTPNQPRLPFSHSQRPFSHQSVLQRSTSPLLLPSYQQPHVFGQMTLLSPLPSLQSPSLFQTNMPTLIPTSENYYHPRFMRNPSPNSQNNFPSVNPQRFPRGPSPYHSQRPLPDPWIPTESPNSARIPPNHPLTVQIPNLNSPPLSVNPFQPSNDPVQPFMNNMNLYNRNRPSRFY